MPQYACLELLDQHPGLSNAELARGAFVTRQSMNVVLRGLQYSGLVSRPLQPPHGRALPASLTAAHQHRFAAARGVVVAIEQRMTGALPPQRAARLLADLGRMAQALEPPQHDLRGRISSNPPADGHRTCQVRAQTRKRQDSQHKIASQSHEATITTQSADQC